MAYGMGAFCSDDDKYTDFEAWWDPYFCCEQFFTSTAAFNTHKAMFHGPRGAGGRRPFGGGGAAATGGLFGGGSGGGTGAGAVPAPAPASSGGAGAGGKKTKKSKKQRQRNARSPPAPPPPVTENLVVGFSLEFSAEGKVNAQLPTPSPPSLIEDNLVLGSSLGTEVSEVEHPDGGAGGSGGGGERTERAGTVPTAAPGAGADRKKKKNKKKGQKTGKGNAQVSAAPTSATPITPDDAFMDLLFGGSRFGGARGGGGVLGSEPSEDDSELSDLSDIGYGVFGGYGGYMGCDYYEDYEDYEDSDDEYITHCVNKINSKNNHRSRKGTKMSRAACDDDYSCNRCKECVGVKHEYLLHMAILHRLCGACESQSQEEKKTDDSGFDHKDHFKSSENCLYNPKFKLGRVEITEIPDSEAVDSPKFKLGRVQITKVPDSEAVDNPKFKLGRVEMTEVPDSEAVNRQFVCLICGEDSGSAFALIQHSASTHTKCHCCKIQFDAQEDLSQHFLFSKVHSGKYCETCKMVFSSKKSVGIHCTKSHSVGTSNQIAGGVFTCDACTKVVRSFPTEDELETHLQFEHVRCFPCKREFGQKKSLHNHLTAASQHNFCVRCDSDFMSSKSLTLHDCPGNAARTVAQKEVKRNHWVPVVPKQNGGSIDDRLSASDATQNSVTKPIPAVGEDSEDEEDLNCCQCQEEFDTLDERKWHEYDNHIWCTKCDKQLASRRAFIHHQNKAEGHYMCFECGEHFITQTSLLQHKEVTNHGFPVDNAPSDRLVKTRKFVCDDCDFKAVFKTEKELAAHLGAKH